MRPTGFAILHRVRPLVVWLALLGGTAACAARAAPSGGASPPPTSNMPTAAPTTEEKKGEAIPSTADQGDTKGATVQPVPGATTNAPTIADQLGAAQTQLEASIKAYQAAGDDCTSLCKALNSMQRAADHLCDLAKDAGATGGVRCNDARARVAEAKSRVEKKCGGCGPA